MVNTPVSAPLAMELNISSAEYPASEKAGEYSDITSINSSFSFNPASQPWASKLYASSADIPNWFIKESTVLTDSSTSTP